MQQEIFDIAIIGAGPAGLFATFYAGVRGMKTLLIEALPEMGGQLITLYPEKYIYDVAGFPKILARDLVNNLIEQMSRFHPTVRLGEQVIGLRQVEGSQPPLFTVTTRKQSYQARSVLIAAGVGAFSPNTLDVPGIAELENRGVFYFVRNKSEFAGRRLLIVGGGDSAVDWALNLRDVAHSITLIHRRDKFRAHEASVDMLMQSSVNVLLSTELVKVFGTEWVEGATLIQNNTQEQQDIAVDAILLTLGFKADLGPIKDWGLPIEQRTIPVNAHQATCVPGIFAAGDIAGTAVKLDLITVGFAQAAIAVNNAKLFIDPQAKPFPGHSSSCM